MGKITTRYWMKPGPIRNCDWIAFYDGQEELGHYGHGRTDGEAIADLVTNYPSEDDGQFGVGA